MTMLSDIEFSIFKWACHIERLRDLALGGDTYPVTVELDLVDYCNHHCGWCVDPRHGNTAMPYKTATGICIELSSLGVIGLVLKGGGEPTLHPEFAPILRFAREQGFDVGVVTNGSRLEVYSESLARYASYVRVSIDGPTSESHKAIHGSPDYEDILKGVRALVRRRAKARHPVIGLSFAVDFVHRSLVPAALDLGADLGADYVLLRPPFLEETGHVNYLTIDEKRAIFDAFALAVAGFRERCQVFVDYWVADSEWNDSCLPRHSPRRGARPNLRGNGVEHDVGRCLASPLVAVIAADATVYPCCNLRFLDNWSIGQIDYEAGRTFASLWSSTSRREIRNRIEQIECIRFCTHPLSRYNEVIEYLKSPQYHRGFL